MAFIIDFFPRGVFDVNSAVLLGMAHAMASARAYVVEVASWGYEHMYHKGRRLWTRDTRRFCGRVPIFLLTRISTTPDTSLPDSARKA